MTPVLISALEHWIYCPRQCGLIHLEQVWDENIFTIKGDTLHERVDTPITRSERGKRVERALPIWSDLYGLVGKADAVEFDESGRPTPVEFKSGKESRNRSEHVQLCGQAICLEEMFECVIEEAFVFYAASRQRKTVAIDEKLREKTLRTVEEIREMLLGDQLPGARFDQRCRNCSLIDACIPQGLVQASLTKPAALFAPRKEAFLP